MDNQKKICATCRWSAEVTGCFRTALNSWEQYPFEEITTLCCFCLPPTAGRYPENRPETAPHATCSRWEGR